MVDRSLGRIWLLGIPIGVLVAVAVLVVLRPWHATAGSEELSVEQATLRPGTIALVLLNGSEEKIELLLSSGGAVEYGIEDAEPGSQPAEAA